MLQKAWKTRKRIRAKRRGKRKTTRRKGTDSSGAPELERRGRNNDVQKIVQNARLYRGKQPCRVREMKQVPQRTPYRTAGTTTTLTRAQQASHRKTMRHQTANGHGDRRGDLLTVDTAPATWHRGPTSLPRSQSGGLVNRWGNRRGETPVSAGKFGKYKHTWRDTGGTCREGRVLMTSERQENFDAAVPAGKLCNGSYVRGTTKSLHTLNSFHTLCVVLCCASYRAYQGQHAEEEHTPSSHCTWGKFP